MNKRNLLSSVALLGTHRTAEAEDRGEVSLIISRLPPIPRQQF